MTDSKCNANWGGTHTPVRRYEVPHTFLKGTYIYIEPASSTESAPGNAKLL